MKKIIAILLVLVMVFALSSCGDDSQSSGASGSSVNFDINIDEIMAQEPASLVIIAGKHANSYNFTSDMCADAKACISKAIRVEKIDGSYIATIDLKVIVNDGNPAIENFTIGNASSLATKANNKEMLEQRIKGLLDEIVRKLASDEVMAREPGCDLQGAINQAQKALRDKTSKKHILIMDTGISTEGYINMCEMDFVYSSAESMISCIRPGGFPDLTGIDVTFLGLGNVATPQPEFYNNTEAEGKLEKFWTIYLEEKCGATLTKSIIVVPKPEGEILSADKNSTNPYPEVPIVEVVSTTKIGPISIKMEDIGFVGDKAEFKNKAKAAEVINEAAAELAEYLEVYPDMKVYVVGSVARAEIDEPEKQDDYLSKRRAEKVLELLLESGHDFNSENFIVIDAGTQEFSWRNANEFPDGELDRKEQEKNRVVAIIPEKCDDAVAELRAAEEIPA